MLAGLVQASHTVIPYIAGYFSMMKIIIDSNIKPRNTGHVYLLKLIGQDLVPEMGELQGSIRERNTEIPLPTRPHCGDSVWISMPEVVGLWHHLGSFPLASLLQGLDLAGHSLCITADVP